uniref:Uncharacterized protein n=1 Tax=Chenopodium quinoa TaxID=63459 RepID=A0A803M2S2_CHEQI
MAGAEPKIILTDQDQAMSNAMERSGVRRLRTPSIRDAPPPSVATTSLSHSKETGENDRPNQLKRPEKTTGANGGNCEEKTTGARKGERDGEGMKKKRRPPELARRKGEETRPGDGETEDRRRSLQEDEIALQ